MIARIIRKYFCIGFSQNKIISVMFDSLYYILSFCGMETTIPDFTTYTTLLTFDNFPNNGKQFTYHRVVILCETFCKNFTSGNEVLQRCVSPL